MTARTVRYYAATYNGKTYTEVLVTNQDRRLVSEEPTGTSYRTFRAMEDGVAAKNRALITA